MIQLFNSAVRTGNKVHSITLYKDGPADIRAAQYYPDVHLHPGLPHPTEAKAAERPAHPGDPDLLAFLPHTLRGYQKLV